MSKYDLIKFGVSEFKRNDFKNQFVTIATWFNKKKNQNRKYSNVEIFSAFKKNKIYKDQKQSLDIKRELSFFKSVDLLNYKWIRKENVLEKDKKILKNLKENQDIKQNINEGNIKYLKINITDFLRGWGNGNKIESFHNVTEDDFSFLKLLMKFKYKENGIEKSSFYHIFNFIKNNDGVINKNIIISENYKKYITNIITNKNQEEILKIVKFKSKSSNKNVNKYQDKLIKIYIEWQLDMKNNNKKDNFLEIFKKHINDNSTQKIDGLFELFFGSNKKYNSLKQIQKIWNKNPNEIILELEKQTINNLNERIIERIIIGSWNSYKNLIINYLGGLEIFWTLEKISKDEEKLIINPDFQKTLNLILKNENKILNLKKQINYNPINFKNHFELENACEKNLTQSTIQDINSKFNLEECVKYLIIFKNFYNKENYELDNKKVMDFLKNDKEFQNRDFPTVFEYLIGVSIIVKLEKKITYKNLNKHLNMRLDSTLKPVRFASGGRPDSQFVFDNELIIFEPTTQIRRQTTMELESIWSHLNKLSNEYKKEKNIGFMVSPYVSKNFLIDRRGRNDEKYKCIKRVEAMDIEILIKFLEHDFEDPVLSLTNFISEKYISGIKK